MFDFGLSFSHILVIVVLAVIAIGPKDLPVVLRRLGQFMNRMRGMARDFQGQVDAAMKDAGMEDIRQDLQSLKSGVSAAMSPASTLMSGAANAVTSGSASPVTAVPTAASVSNSMAASLNAAPAEFDRYFGAGKVGETRVQGKALGEAQS